MVAAPPDSTALSALEAEVFRLESQIMREAAWGDLVNTREYLSDDAGFGILGGPGRTVYTTSLDDRRDGRFRPIYETEQDLARFRAQARNLALLTGIRTGALTTLQNYTFSGGFKFTAAPEDETDAQGVGLVPAVQQVIDRLLDENDFCGVIDREVDLRAREDGECLLAFDDEEIARGCLRLEFLEPDQLMEPANPYQLDEWLGMDGPSCWKFGVHTPERKTAKVLGYHIVRDDRGADWDYYPESRVQHIKRNVTINAKRGVTDFVEILSDLSGEAKLANNMTRGAALQAAIAWILQGAQGTTQSQMSSVGPADKVQYVRPSVFSGGSQTVQNASHYPAGSILRTPAGQEYLPGPMGAERNAGFELVGQYALRRIGVRWNMPEYMISGDASNANYSSTLVAGSPFAEARKADQQFYKRHFLSLIWKAVRICVEHGRFSRWGIQRDHYHLLEKLVRIDCECPTVDARDSKVAVDSDKVLVDGGVMSKQTWATRNNLDFEKEQKLGALEKPPEPVMGAFGQPMPGQAQGQPGKPGMDGKRKPFGQPEVDDKPRDVQISTDALSESWDETKHPRDSQGQFSLGANIASEEHFRSKSAAKNAGFTQMLVTSKGSKYLVKDGGTSRMKASEGNGQGEIHGHSTATHYVDQATADKVMEVMRDYSVDPHFKASVRSVGNGRIGIVVKNRKTGQVDNSKSLLLKSVTSPTVGKSPIEVWDKDSQGRYGFHIGHAISSIHESVDDHAFDSDPSSGAKKAAVSAALESVQTTDEAKAIIAQLTEVYP